METLPLYGFERLSDLPPGTRVFVVEGEKAADALLEPGYLAFGTVTGATARRPPTCCASSSRST